MHASPSPFFSSFLSFLSFFALPLHCYARLRERVAKRERERFSCGRCSLRKKKKKKKKKKTRRRISNRLMGELMGSGHGFL